MSLIFFFKRIAFNSMMSTTAEIRLSNLNALIEEFGTQDEVAALAGTSQVYLSQLRNGAADSKTGRPREIGPRLARKLETGCKKDKGWMDISHDMPAVHRVSEPTPIYEFQKPSVDPMAAELMELFAKLDKKDKSECLSFVRVFVMSRHPHAFGPASSVAG